jgi:hypothetical protein
MAQGEQRRSSNFNIRRGNPGHHEKGDHYSEVSARIVAELERGAAPWIPISTGQGSYDKLNTEVAAGVKTDVEQRFGSASTIGGARTLEQARSLGLLNASRESSSYIVDVPMLVAPSQNLLAE